MHTFEKPIRTVAVIGSGPSGTPAARHLQEAGLEVRVFERQPQPGGIWNWRPEVSPVTIPTPPPVIGAFSPVTGTNREFFDPDRVERDRFCPANPVYWSLSNNVPTTTMAFKDFPYPPNTPSNIPHHRIAGYVHAYARHFQIDAVTSYNTRVERVERGHCGWRLHLRSLRETDTPDRVVETTWDETFDAIVVATGHYTAPFIPRLPGIEAWAKAWPDRVIHSQGYRRPEPHRGKNVLIVGTGTSGIDIAWDLSGANTVYLVGKNEITGPEQHRRQRILQRHLLPPNGLQLGEIRSFKRAESIEASEIELQSGQRITNISAVIFATGYQYSFPFLPEYHTESSPTSLVSTGEGVHNLYRDVFYIPDPTLAFVGLSINTSAFSFFEYQSMSIARVFAGTARLPSEKERRDTYARHVTERGSGRFSHLLGKEGERKYVRETVEWLNQDAEWSGAERVEGHSTEWLEASDDIINSIAQKYGVDPAKIFANGALSHNPVPRTVRVDGG